MRMTPLGILLGCLALGGCTRTAGGRAPSSDRARDSAIGASALPGAQGVRGALRASDSAAARRTVEDSISRDTEP